MKGNKLANGVLVFLVCALLTLMPAYGASINAGKDTLVDKLHEEMILIDEELDELKERDKAHNKVIKYLEGLSAGILSYVDFSGSEMDGETYKSSSVPRGYINLKNSLGGVNRGPPCTL